MKSVHRKLIASVIALALLSLAACFNRNEPDSSSTPSSPGDAEDTAAAIFSLHADGQDGRAMKIGDHIGDWTLLDLKMRDVWNGSETVISLSAFFEGEVTLSGTLTRAPYEGYVYYFTAAKEYETKMPHYKPEWDDERDLAFRLNFTENMENVASGINLEVDETQDCVITISDYRCVASPYGAPSSAMVIGMQLS